MLILLSSRTARGPFLRVWANQPQAHVGSSVLNFLSCHKQPQFFFLSLLSLLFPVSPALCLQSLLSHQLLTSTPFVSHPHTIWPSSSVEGSLSPPAVTLSCSMGHRAQVHINKVKSITFPRGSQPVTFPYHISCETHIYILS